MENSKPTEQPKRVERTGKYTRVEREHFNTILGPGAAVAIESIRKITGMRLKINQGNVKHPEA